MYPDIFTDLLYLWFVPGNRFKIQGYAGIDMIAPIGLFRPLLPGDKTIPLKPIQSFLFTEVVLQNPVRKFFGFYFLIRFKEYV